MKNVLKLLPKSVLLSLGLIKVVSATDEAIQKKFFQGKICMISRKKLFLQSVSGVIENESKEQIGGFLGVLLGELGASLLDGWHGV